ncbi:MAG: FAD-binding protein, partial [Ancalomicrobiaceae bacterium]|nr:FAD-binding protein [Ancalomicrobiaceae bacterium]
PDVRSYLAKAGALLATPLERLSKMNPLSIELYKRYKRDITREPLEFGVNNQHMNGGLAVDIWGETSLADCYAVGEAAGTHGVTRPGGAALNAGQVFGTRAAERIAARSGRAAASMPGDDLVAAALTDVLAALRADSSLRAEAIRSEVQARMSDHAGILCRPGDVAAALQAARALNNAIARHGIAYGSAGEALDALQWRQMALASEAVLTALAFYIERGGGSRGARAICDAAGSSVPAARDLSLEAYRFLPERLEDRNEQILVCHQGSGFSVATRPLRGLDGGERPFFERDWPDYLTGAIYDPALDGGP